MRRLKYRVILGFKQMTLPFWGPALKPKYRHEHVPYFAQWESRELVEAIKTKKIATGDDPRWRESGALNKEEYTAWSWSACGMACLKMILADALHREVPLVELGKKCLAYGGYRMPLESSPGLFYKPFVRFIKAEFGLHGRAVSALTTAEIKRALSQGGYVMASVTPEIRHPHVSPKKRGGHLVLVTGYDDEREVFYLHNPSGFKDTQENLAISYADFAKFFDHKGILVFTQT